MSRASRTPRGMRSWSSWEAQNIRIFYFLQIYSRHKSWICGMWSLYINARKRSVLVPLLCVFVNHKQTNSSGLLDLNQTTTSLNKFMSFSYHLVLFVVGVGGRQAVSCVLTRVFAFVQKASTVTNRDVILPNFFTICWSRLCINASSSELIINFDAACSVNE